MSDNVIQLAVSTLEPDPEVVDSARTLLKLAEAGELDGICWAATYTDGATGQSGWGGKAGPQLFGQITLLLHDRLQAYRGSDNQ